MTAVRFPNHTPARDLFAASEAGRREYRVRAGRIAGAGSRAAAMRRGLGAQKPAESHSPTGFRPPRARRGVARPVAPRLTLARDPPRHHAHPLSRCRLGIRPSRV